MSSAIENILLQDHLSKGDLKDIETACKADASLSVLVKNWVAVKNHVRLSLSESMPESRLLVLYALGETSDDALSLEERDELRSAEAQINSALTSHPAVEAIIGRIRSEAVEFNTIWEEYTATTPALAATFAPVVDAVSSKVSGGLLRRIGRSIALKPGWYGIAAAITMLVASLVIFQQMNSGFTGVTIGTPDGKVNLVSLPDGSKVRLSAGSSITLAGTDTFERQLTLDGSAFFDVVPSDIRFEIETTNASVVVYGTSFGVTAATHSDITEVTLVSGSVSLSSANEDDAVLLNPGEFSRVVGDSSPTEPQIVDLESALSWSDLFVFRDTPLSQVAERLSERFELPIAVDEELLNRTVTGTFAPENGLRFILDAVAAALNVRVETSDDNQVYSITS